MFRRNVLCASFSLRGLYSSLCHECQISFLAQQQQKVERNSLEKSLTRLDQKNECVSKQIFQEKKFLTTS